MNVDNITEIVMLLMSKGLCVFFKWIVMYFFSISISIWSRSEEISLKFWIICFRRISQLCIRQHHFLIYVYYSVVCVGEDCEKKDKTSETPIKKPVPKEKPAEDHSVVVEDIPETSNTVTKDPSKEEQKQGDFFYIYGLVHCVSFWKWYSC